MDSPFPSPSFIAFVSFVPNPGGLGLHGHIIPEAVYGKQPEAYSLLTPERVQNIWGGHTGWGE